jgi:hypothetical protein
LEAHLKEAFFEVFGPEYHGQRGSLNHQDHILLLIVTQWGDFPPFDRLDSGLLLSLWLSEPSWGLFLDKGFDLFCLLNKYLAQGLSCQGLSLLHS